MVEIVGQALARQKELPAEDPAAPAPARESGPAAAPLAGKKILVAEDNLVNKEFIEEILAQMGCKVVSALNGKEALDHVANARFDLVLMDCQMPVVDGYEAARRIRLMESEGLLPRFPIVALTANAMKGDREKCLEAGMDDYLFKPVRKNDLREAVLYWTSCKRESQGTAGRYRSEYEDMNAQDAPLLSAPEAAEAREIMADRFEATLDACFDGIDHLIAEIRAGVEARDIARVHRAAHDIKSSSRQFGALRLSCLARDLERDMRALLDRGGGAIDGEELRLRADGLLAVYRQTVALFQQETAASA
jgi:CheY-like chemotaxis protein